MLRHPLFRIMSILRGDYPKRARAKKKSTKTSLHSYERKSHFRPEGQVYGVDAISWCYDWVRERCCWGGLIIARRYSKFADVSAFWHISCLEIVDPSESNEIEKRNLAMRTPTTWWGFFFWFMWRKLSMTLWCGNWIEFLEPFFICCGN